jgi:hypothetical protein
MVIIIFIHSSLLAEAQQQQWLVPDHQMGVM